MALSTEAVKRIMIAASDQVLGQEIASAIESGASHSDVAAAHIAAFIVATSVSATVDFGALKVGDKVARIQQTVTATQTGFYTVAVAGTLPAAAVVGDLYIVIRGFAPPAKRLDKF